MRTGGDDHNSLLNGGASNIGGAVDQIIGVHLPGAGDAEQRCRRKMLGGPMTKGEIGEVFGCSDGIPLTVIV